MLHVKGFWRPKCDCASSVVYLVQGLEDILTNGSAILADVLHPGSNDSKGEGPRSASSGGSSADGVAATDIGGVIVKADAAGAGRSSGHMDGGRR